MKTRILLCYAFVAALIEAGAANKGMLVLQVGSDWCESGDYVRKVFDSSEFRMAVRRDFDFAVYDDMDKPTDAVKAANKKVAGLRVESRRFPSMKRELSDYEDRIQKAHPGIASLYRHYALFRRCAAPDFRAKSASEAKKLAGELEKAKPVLKRLGDDPKDVAVQNMALSLLQRLDDLIGELPSKVQEK